jgi:hypothetical protein
MRRPTIAAFVLANLASPRAVVAENSPARALIERSITYHDPGGAVLEVEPAAMPAPGDGE